MLDVEYSTDKNGRPKAVVIPLDSWRQLLLEENALAQLAEEVENYCLNKAMDEAHKTPLMTREEALTYLEE